MFSFRPITSGLLQNQFCIGSHLAKHLLVSSCEGRIDPQMRSREKSPEETQSRTPTSSYHQELFNMIHDSIIFTPCQLTSSFTCLHNRFRNSFFASKFFTVDSQNTAKRQPSVAEPSGSSLFRNLLLFGLGAQVSATKKYCRPPVRNNHLDLEEQFAWPKKYGLCQPKKCLVASGKIRVKSYKTMPNPRFFALH